MDSIAPTIDSFSIEGFKRFGMNPSQALMKRNGSSSPIQYLESGPTSCPTAKHVLYVEVVPSRRVKLEQDTETEEEASENDEDPLMMNTSPSPPPKKKKKKDKHRVKLRAKRDVKYDFSEIKLEMASSPDSPPSPDRSYSPLWSPKVKHSKKKKAKRKHRESLKCNRSNCSYIAEDANDLNAHKKLEHKGKKHFQCDQCVYGGSTASDLRKHYRQHTGEIPYTCSIMGCEYKAKHNNSLVYHTKKYHPTGPPIKCDASETCVFTTYLRAALRHHKMMAHGGGKTLACEHCPYKCYLMADLRKHHRVHTGENPYHCDFEGCHYACKISSNLKKHKRIHTEEKPYACDVCEFRTNFINSLKVHKRTHTNERPYCCDQCGYRCNHTSNLKKHVARLHPGAVYTIVKMPPVEKTSTGMQTMDEPPL